MLQTLAAIAQLKYTPNGVKIVLSAIGAEKNRTSMKTINPIAGLRALLRFGRAPGQDRTGTLRFRRPLLYPLSYGSKQRRLTANIGLVSTFSNRVSAGENYPAYSARVYLDSKGRCKSRQISAEALLNEGDPPAEPIELARICPVTGL